MTDCVTTPCIVTQPITDRAGIFFDVWSVFFFFFSLTPSVWKGNRPALVGVLAYNAGWKCFGKVTWHWLKLISGTACLCGLKEGLKGLWERREAGEGTRLHYERRRFVKWAELACRREWTWKTETSWGFTLLQSWPWAPHSCYGPLLCYPVLKPATGREARGQDLIHPSQGNQVGPVVPQ